MANLQLGFRLRFLRDRLQLSGQIDRDKGRQHGRVESAIVRYVAAQPEDGAVVTDTAKLARRAGKMRRVLLDDPGNAEGANA